MIDLKSVFEKYPECVGDAGKLKAYLFDLYPGEKAKIVVIAGIYSAGIADEIMKANAYDELAVTNYCSRLENDYAFSPKVSRECLLLLYTAYGKDVTDIPKNTQATEYKPETEKGLLSSRNISTTLVKVGDTIKFGKYPQGAGGKEVPIEWQVLAKENEKVLVISKQALDCLEYNMLLDNVTWETCSLRKWMNGTFLNNAFSAEEQSQIQNTNVSADKNPKYRTNPGNATTDKVFLLSITEAEKYFTTEEARKCAPTAYAKAKRALTSDSYKTASGEATCCWWLRSPGVDQCFPACVDDDGSVYYEGGAVDDVDYAVRPALWIKDVTDIPKNTQATEYKPETEKGLLSSRNISRTLVKVGDTIKFGKYPQGASGKEAPIEWQVLANENEKVLVISKQALDCQPYNTSRTDVTWERCSLRKWMNGKFLNNAFSAKEQSQIQNTNVSADKNPRFNTDPGNATTDKVFLLSITEAEKYFTTWEALKCAPTAYAKAKGVSTSDSYITASGEATCYWWFRSPGVSQRFAACGGSIGYFGDHVNRDSGAVRPALWIDLDS